MNRKEELKEKRVYSPNSLREFDFKEGYKVGVKETKQRILEIIDEWKERADREKQYCDEGFEVYGLIEGTDFDKLIGELKERINNE